MQFGNRAFYRTLPASSLTEQGLGHLLGVFFVSTSGAFILGKTTVEPLIVGATTISPLYGGHTWLQPLTVGQTSISEFS